MRVLAGVILGTAMLGAPATAQATDDAPALRGCDDQAALVMQAVNARVDGQPKRRIRRDLRADLGRDAGDMLAEWIYALPDEQLTEEVGTAWRVQCEAALQALQSN